MSETTDGRLQSSLRHGASVSTAVRVISLVNVLLYGRLDPAVVGLFLSRISQIPLLIVMMTTKGLRSIVLQVDLSDSARHAHSDEFSLLMRLACLPAVILATLTLISLLSLSFLAIDTDFLHPLLKGFGAPTTVSTSALLVSWTLSFAGHALDSLPEPIYLVSRSCGALKVHSLSELVAGVLSVAGRVVLLLCAMFAAPSLQLVLLSCASLFSGLSRALVYLFFYWRQRRGQLNYIAETGCGPSGVCLLPDLRHVLIPPHWRDLRFAGSLLSLSVRSIWKSQSDKLVLSMIVTGGAPLAFSSLVINLAYGFASPLGESISYAYSAACPRPEGKDASHRWPSLAPVLAQLHLPGEKADSRSSGIELAPLRRVMRMSMATALLMCVLAIELSPVLLILYGPAWHTPDTVRSGQLALVRSAVTMLVTPLGSFVSTVAHGSSFSWALLVASVSAGLSLLVQFFTKSIAPAVLIFAAAWCVRLAIVVTRLTHSFGGSALAQLSLSRQRLVCLVPLAVCLLTRLLILRPARIDKLAHSLETKHLVARLFGALVDPAVLIQGLLAVAAAGVSVWLVFSDRSRNKDS